MSWRIYGMIIMMFALWGVLSLQRVNNSHLLSVSNIAHYTISSNQADVASNEVTSTNEATAVRPAQPLNWETLFVYVVQLFAVAMLVFPLVNTILNESSEDEPPTQVKNPLLNVSAHSSKIKSTR